MQKKKRTALEATIDVVGRDQQDQILYLKKDPETQIWNLERMETEPHKESPDPVLEAVAKLVSVERQEWTGSPSELAETVQVGMAANALLLMQKKKRTALEATIDVVGRDQQDQILYLKKDPETQIWNLERMETEPHREPPDPVLEAVAKLVNPLSVGVDRLSLGAGRSGTGGNGGKCADKIPECQIRQAVGRISCRLREQGAARWTAGETHLYAGGGSGF